MAPNIVEEGETPQEAHDWEAIMYNPKIVSHSVQDAALGEGEGCLSVDRNVPGYVVRHARVTADYFDKDGENTVSNSKATTPLLFSTKLTTLTVSCFTIASMKKTHLQLKMLY